MRLTPCQSFHQNTRPLPSDDRISEKLWVTDYPSSPCVVMETLSNCLSFLRHRVLPWRSSHQNTCPVLTSAACSVFSSSSSSTLSSKSEIWRGKNGTGEKKCERWERWMLGCWQLRSRCAPCHLKTHSSKRMSKSRWNIIIHHARVVSSLQGRQQWRSWGIVLDKSSCHQLSGLTFVSLSSTSCWDSWSSSFWNRKWKVWKNCLFRNTISSQGQSLAIQVLNNESNIYSKPCRHWWAGMKIWQTIANIRFCLMFF